MNASRQRIDSTLFKGFTPLSDLDLDTLHNLARLAAIENIAAGNFLFERGDTTQRTFYLLEGEIELCSPLFPTQMVRANTEAGRYPLAHSFPRQFTAVTVSEVRVLILPLDIADVMQRDSAIARPATSNEPNTLWESRWLESPMLRLLSTTHKKALLSNMEEITVQAGQVIIHQDEPADSYYVIKNGRCSVSRKPSPGARDVKLAELTEGQGFGEEALITNVARNASVSMLSDGILLRLGKQDFIELMAKPLLHHLPFQQAIQLVEQGAVLIDVRTPEEFEIDGLIGSLNMPIPVLRLKANRLSRDRTYIVYSNTGQISSVAVFLLIQQGLNAHVLAGGLNTAPKYRMKRGSYGEHSRESQTVETPSNKTILPFPIDPAQEQREVDWHHVSDEVLWRTTIGYRKDTGVEAAMAAKPTRSGQQTSDTTTQGFDDIRLFTTINSLQDMKLSSDDETRGGYSEPGHAGSNRSHVSQPLNKKSGNPAAPGATLYNRTPQWSNKAYRSPWQRFMLAIMLMVVLLGSGLGYFYFSNGKLPINLESASPILLEQQQKLDAKVSRLLDAIESMPALQHNLKSDGDSPPVTTKPSLLKHNDKSASPPPANAP